MGPLARAEAYSIFSPDAVARVEPARWSQQARTFLDANVVVIADVDDTVELEVNGTRLRVRSFPVSVAPELVAAAEHAVRAMGGAGFDALLARAQRVWQVPIAGHERAALVAAALLASVLLGPILPPDEDVMFGVKGARVRLSQSPA